MSPTPPLIDRLERVGPHLGSPGGRVVLVADRLAYEASGAAARLAPVLAGHAVERLTDFPGTPCFGPVLDAAERLREDPESVVLAVGGGAAIDTAKLLCFAATTDPAACRADPVGAISNAKADTARRPRLVAVPTTAGTGSEATPFAVVYVNQVKHSVERDWLLPDAVVLDPSLTASLPAPITAATGLDALCQAIESLWAVRSTDASSAWAQEALQIAWRWLPQSVEAPTAASRAAMLQAAHLAGRAIAVSRTTAPHALSYHLTIHHGVAHGPAVAVSLAPLLRYNAAVDESSLADERGVEHVRGRLQQIALTLSGRASARPSGPATALVEEACEAWTALLRSIGAPTRLGQLGVETPGQLDAFAQAANPQRLSNNPRRLTEEALRQLVESYA